jgi:hypothetical protein
MLSQVNGIIKDMRNVMRNDSRVMTKLHRRIFLEKVKPKSPQP